MISDADFDHVALAAESRRDLEPRYADQLGGVASTDAAGGQAGFTWAQVRYRNGMALEMLEPYRVQENDFLRRFLDRNGPGPHHLTFTVPHFGGALEAAVAAGYRPVGVDDSSPQWKEAFLHPKDAPGVVIQLAESHEHHELPRVPPSPSAELLHVAHAVRSLDDGLRLFEALLGGVRAGEGEGSDHRWIELRWPGPGRVRLLVPTGPGALDEWIGGRPGRVHHVAFRVPDLSALPGATANGEYWRVEPEANQGTRLVLVAGTGSS